MKGREGKTNKIHKHSNFLDYRYWSKSPGRRGRQSPRCCWTFPYFLHDQQAKMRATTILKWSKLKLKRISIEYQNKTFQPTFNRKSLDRNQLLAFLRSSPNVRPHICWHLFSCWLNLSHRIVISLLGPLFSVSTCSFPGNSPRDCEESSTTVADPAVHRIKDRWSWRPLHRLSQARGAGLSWGGLLTAAGFNLKFASMQCED